MPELKHSGVKGMHWGVRRNPNRLGGADGKFESEKIVDKRGTVQKHLDSWKREREWHKVLKEVHNMSTKDINIASKRIKAENNLKTLSKNKRIATKKDRQDYLNRDKMSDQELTRKVSRLQAKEGLHKAVNDASKTQREFGEKVVQIGSSVGVKYALNRGTITGKDLFNTALEVSKTPKESYNKSRDEVLDNVKDPRKKWLVDKSIKAFEKKWQVKTDKK